MLYGQLWYLHEPVGGSIAPKTVPAADLQSIVIPTADTGGSSEIIE